MESYQNPTVEDEILQEYDSYIYDENEYDHGNVYGYDIDTLLDEVSKTDDVSAYDDIVQAIQQEMREKCQMLSRIRQQNSQMQNMLNTERRSVQEFDQLDNDEWQKCEKLRRMIEARRQELELIHSRQVNDIVQFEDDVRKISDKLMTSPRQYEENGLMDVVLQLRQDLEDKKLEMFEYKQELLEAGDKFRQATQDSDYNGSTLKVFEEGINDIYTLNEKLTYSVSEITNEMNKLRYDISSLNLHSGSQA